MESKPEKHALLTRLALCVGAAIVLCRGAERLPLPQPWLDWLEENRLAAIAAAAAGLFLLSLLLAPLEEEEEAGEECLFDT